MAHEPKSNAVLPRGILLEYEQLRTTAEILNRDLELIGASLNELQIVRHGVDKISGLKEKNEILVPLGGDSFIKAKVTDREGIIMGIGSGVAVGKSIPEAREDLENRGKELEGLQAVKNETLQKTLKRMGELAPHVQKIISELPKEG